MASIFVDGGARGELQLRCETASNLPGKRVSEPARRGP